MNWHEIERRFASLNFPGLIKAIVGLQLVAYVLLLVMASDTRRGNFVEILQFDVAKIFQGQVWRVFTFLLVNGFRHPLFVIIFFMFMLFIADVITSVWGNLRTNLFIIATYLAIVVSGFFIYFLAFLTLGQAGLEAYNNIIRWTYSGFFLAEALIILAAFVNPNIEIMLFFIIPMKLRWLGIITAGLLFFMVISSPVLLPIILASHIVLIIVILIGKKKDLGAKVRKAKFEQSVAIKQESFHKCWKCGKTEVSHPETEFRIGDDDHEICNNCGNF